MLLVRSVKGELDHGVREDADGFGDIVHLHTSEQEARNITECCPRALGKVFTIKVVINQCPPDFLALQPTTIAALSYGRLESC